MIFSSEEYTIEFCDENEADDGDLGPTKYLRLYCFNREGEELASICTNLPTETSREYLQEISSSLISFLKNNSDFSVFRTLERYTLMLANSEKQKSRLNEVQI